MAPEVDWRVLGCQSIIERVVDRGSTIEFELTLQSLLPVVLCLTRVLLLGLSAAAATTRALLRRLATLQAETV